MQLNKNKPGNELRQTGWWAGAQRLQKKENILNRIRFLEGKTENWDKKPESNKLD